MTQYEDDPEAHGTTVFNINQLEAMHLARSAWESVTQQTIANCWRHTGILPSPTDTVLETTPVQQGSIAKDKDLEDIVEKTKQSLEKLSRYPGLPESCKKSRISIENLLNPISESKLVHDSIPMPTEDDILASMNQEDLDITDEADKEENDTEDPESDGEPERVAWNLTKMKTTLNEIEFGLFSQPVNQSSSSWMPHIKSLRLLATQIEEAQWICVHHPYAYIAGSLYLGLRNNHGDKSWAWWKNAIRNKFGTDHWRWKVQEEFEADRFSLENRKIHKWFNTQRERLRAYQPELSEFLVCEKVLKQCPGTLDHAIKSRYNKEPSEMNFEDMVIIAEAVIDRTMRPGPTPNHLSYNNKHFSNSQNSFKRNDAPRQDSDVKKTPSNQAGTKPTKCFFCFQTGHLPKDCPKKRNRVNNVEAQGGEDDPDPNENVDDYDYDQPLNSDENNEDNQQNSALVLAMHQHDMDHPMMSLGNHAIECELPQDLSIAEIQAACHQPQTWSTDCQTSHIEDARLI
ncbi:hypothetical protein Pst134EB_030072 [Puccinia striiformis f. sp. tritici]|nr:hypothetical protein Pst134EB_030072 [Puccinia striiformis f. sp. tritici]